MATEDKKHSDGVIDTIVPIDFAPNQGKTGSFKFRFGWKHLFGMVFLLVSGTTAWFITTAKSVYIDVNPLTASVEIEGGLAVKMGVRYLIREGVYDLRLTNAGYYDLETNLFVLEEQSQTHPVSMQRLPGIVTIESLGLAGARVQIDGVDIGSTPLLDAQIDAGEHELMVTSERYLPATEQIVVEGREVRERFEVELDPAWAVVTVTSTPPGADVLVDGGLAGVTPLNAEVLQGEREITVHLAGHKSWQETVIVEPSRDMILPEAALEPADGLVFIRSNPSGASVTVSGVFGGLTPLEVALEPGQTHEVNLFKAGYESSTRTIKVGPDQEAQLNIELNPVTSTVLVMADPADAELYIDGEFQGPANQTIELMAISQQIEIRKQGYVPYTTEFTSRPGLEQAIRVSLKTLEQERQEQIEPVITTTAGQTLKLFYPTAFSMGASRREPGRRPNETLRNIVLEKPFYISLHEVTNRQYKLFKSDHSSGTFESRALGLDSQPVSMVSWNDAALYCNWLSDQEGLTPFYIVAEEEVTGFNPDSTGYRMPTEAEWAWIARTNGSESELKYTWGEQLPPAPGSGNFADASVQAFLGQVLYNYEDGFVGSAPVGEFEPNYHGIYDMAGNVAEWVHDFYGSVGTLGGAPEADPLGPLAGQYHTIRGSSWAHGAVTELRLSFRDFGDEPRDDLGFRIARYLGE